jgi:hypothetical protein
VPVFDAPELRDFLGSAARRLFLAELLTSFTRVTSGRYRVTVGGRARTRRFSELDPVRLAGMLDAVPEESRPGVYRRLGDVALFLSGVFPDYVAGQAFSPVNVARLLRATQVPAGERARLAAIPDLEVVPVRAGPGPGADQRPDRGRRGCGPVPAGPAGAQPRRRPVPDRRLGHGLVRRPRPVSSYRGRARLR